MSKTWRNNEQRDAVLQAMFAWNEIVFFDVETSGLKPDIDYIIEIAAIKCRVENGKLIEDTTFHSYIKPPFEISEKIVQLTGITNEFLADKRTMEDVFPDIFAFFGGNPVICAHNVSFDQRFMSELYRRCGAESFQPELSLDTLGMARDRVDKSTTDNYKLGTLATLFGLDKGMKFHSAMDDITVTKALFEIFSKEYIEEYENRASVSKSQREKPQLISVNFWAGYQGYSRIYAETSSGSVYYCIRTKSWNEKDASIDQIDMEYLEKAVLDAVGCTTLLELERFKGSIKTA